MDETSRGPLHGLRVLDIGTMIAGPFCATLMSDFGADVIKVEHPRHGDPMRAWTPMKNGVSLWWKVTARNKRLVTLDLSRAEGQHLLKQLARTADVVIENYRPGTLERWGLGFPELDAIKPGIVLVRISGYGQYGPYCGRPGYGTVAEAMSGIPSFTGSPDGPPQLSAFPLADCVAGVFGAFSAMFAIYNRDRRGVGEEIDISLYEPLFRMVESQVIGFDQLGLVKQPSGNRMDEDAPRNTYETADGQYVAVSASSPRTFERFAKAIGEPWMADDPRFRDNVSRCANVDALDAIVARWHRAQTLADVLRIFEMHDVVAGPIYDIRRIFEDSHYRARQNIVEVEDCDFGTVRMQNAVPRFARARGTVRHTGRAMGADNEAVFLGECGLGRKEYAALRANGVI